MTRGAHIHIIGICGSGTSGLACLLKRKGFKVTGSDERFYPPASEILEREGIVCTRGYAAANLKNPDLVVEAVAVGWENPESQVARDRGLKIYSFPKALGEFFLKDAFSIVISGTHGKTTITSLIAHILDVAGLDPGFLVGGVPLNFNANFRLGGGRYFVVEGDEYDSALFDPSPKFSHYYPNFATITSIEMDHVDTFHGIADVKAAFKRLVDLMPPDGILIVGERSREITEVIDGAKCRIQRFGFHKGSEWSARQIRLSPKGGAFDLWFEERKIGDFETPLLGEHNIRNSICAIAILQHLGISTNTIREGLRTFRGVKRRLETKGVFGGIAVIDDYAHHPTAVRETLKAAEIRYGPRRVCCVFEPRTHTSRRNVFLKEYAASFVKAKGVIITQVYKADEVDPSERLDPELLCSLISKNGTPALHLKTPDEIVGHLAQNLTSGDAALFMSSGDLSLVQDGLLRTLKRRYDE